MRSLRVHPAWLALVAAVPAVTLAQGDEQVLERAPARRDFEAVVGGWAVRSPEAVEVGQPVVVSFAARSRSHVPIAFVSTVEGPGGGASARASYDPASERELPGCDPMPGDVRPCSREPRLGRTQLVLPGTTFGRRGAYRVVTRAREGPDRSGPVVTIVRVVGAAMMAAHRAHPEHVHGLASRAVVRAAVLRGVPALTLYRGTYRPAERSIDVDVSEPADAAVLTSYLAPARWPSVECVYVATELGPVEQRGCPEGAGAVAATQSTAGSLRVVRIRAGDTSELGWSELAWSSGGRLVRLRSPSIGLEERVIAARYLARMPPD